MQPFNLTCQLSYHIFLVQCPFPVTGESGLELLRPTDWLPPIFSVPWHMLLATLATSYLPFGLPARRSHTILMVSIMGNCGCIPYSEYVLMTIIRGFGITATTGLVSEIPVELSRILSNQRCRLVGDGGIFFPLHVWEVKVLPVPAEKISRAWGGVRDKNRYGQSNVSIWRQDNQGMLF